MAGLWQGIVVRSNNDTFQWIAQDVASEVVGKEAAADASTNINKLVGLIKGEQPKDASMRYIYTDNETHDIMTLVVAGQTFSTMNNAQRVEFAVTWFIVLFMGIGILCRIRRPDETWWLAITCGVILIGTLAVRTAGFVYGIERVFFHVSFIVMPYFVFGCNRISSWLKMNQHIIPVAIVAVYFLAGSGILYYAWGEAIT